MTFRVMACRIGEIIFLMLFVCERVASEDIAPLLQAQTVMITITRSTTEGERDENGSGVIICQNDNQAYILTARHVLFGKSVGERRTEGLSSISRIKIGFFKNVAPPIIEDRTKDEEIITTQQSGRSKDLLLLTVPVQQIIPVTATLGIAPSSSDLGGEPIVYSVGYKVKEGQQGESWQIEGGTLFKREATMLHHSADITEGFSGGPLFNESGGLIGINFEIGNVIEADADPGRQHGHALPIEQVINIIDKWVPASCLKSSDPLRELAYATYRRGMRSISTKEWAAAEKMMREALSQLPWEGGSIHLQGMRYTEYLPRYHLGLALYKQGEKNCGEALREWGRSEVQSAIQGDRRYKKMKKYQRRCVEVLRKNLQAASMVKGEE